MHGYFALHRVEPPKKFAPPSPGVTFPTMACPPGIDVDVLNSDLLLSLATMAVERFGQRRERAAAFVRRVHIGVSDDKASAPVHCLGVGVHRRNVDCPKLCGKHALQLIARLAEAIVDLTHSQNGPIN